MSQPHNSHDGTVFLERARALAPLISSEAATIERDASVSKAVVDALVEQELFWCLIPTDLGGGGLRMTDAIRVGEEISRADGSTGWAFMATGFSTAVIAGFLEQDVAREYFLGGRKEIIAGQLLPRHPGLKVDGGYRLDAGWSFASGSDFATIIGAGFLVADQNGLVLDEAGNPQARIAIVPKEQVEFLGNWDVWGLVGTGSYDYALRELFVPERHTMETLSTTPTHPDSVFTLGALAIGSCAHAANALGLGTRALQEVVTICGGKMRPNYTTPVGESEMFKLEFAKAEASLQAARRYLYHVVDDAQDAGADGTQTPEHIARITQAVTWTQGVATEVVSFAHRWGGSYSIKADSALGRCMRDASIATQHVLVDPINLVRAADAIMPGYRAG
ncbi:MAG TPA: acyl-CoA dehydrogenase family protein [Pseudonocardia sp.]|jgi:alkylation response protein AidB-like acyl-CoA dehydrogenase|nr:acyl-CoA dehydrogenase family protein [Pseudonocardia sp.]